MVVASVTSAEAWLKLASWTFLSGLALAVIAKLYAYFELARDGSSNRWPEHDTAEGGHPHRMGNGTFVYDKAKYHIESVEKFKLPDEHAYNHTTFFMSWLVQNRLMSEWFEEECRSEVASYRDGKISINQLYEYWDTCLISEMLSPEGNAFANDYFNFDRGAYLKDYSKHLQRDLPSEFHVPYTSTNETIAHRFISERYQTWKESRK